MSGLNLPFPSAYPQAAPTSPLLEVDTDTNTVIWTNVQNRPYVFCLEALGSLTDDNTIIGKHTFSQDVDFVEDFIDQFFANALTSPDAECDLELRDASDDSVIATGTIGTDGVTAFDTDGDPVSFLQNETVYLILLTGDVDLANYDITLQGVIPNS